MDWNGIEYTPSIEFGRKGNRGSKWEREREREIGMVYGTN